MATYLSSYIVGERGPEMIVPRSAGNVVPNRAIGRGGTVTVNAPINVTVEGGSRGKEADADLAAKIGGHVEASVRKIVVGELLVQMRPGGLLGR
jgi:hypothetical protein